MMIVMKLSLLLLATSLMAGELGDVKTVYLLPMPGSLDQFLAVRLTTGALFQVVTDPQKADAIFTDHIGIALEQKLDELYGQKQKSQDSKDGDSSRIVAPMTHGKGAIFLVDRKTRNVIWSVYERPKTLSPDDLNRVADRIAVKLEKQLKGK